MVVYVALALCTTMLIKDFLGLTTKLTNYHHISINIPPLPVGRDGKLALLCCGHDFLLVLFVYACKLSAEAATFTCKDIQNERIRLKEVI